MPPCPVNFYLLAFSHIHSFISISTTFALAKLPSFVQPHFCNLVTILSRSTLVHSRLFCSTDLGWFFFTCIANMIIVCTCVHTHTHIKTLNMLSIKINAKIPNLWFYKTTCHTVPCILSILLSNQASSSLSDLQQ